VRVALDAMGTDNAPNPEIEGALAALNAIPQMEIVLVGDKSTLEKKLEKSGVNNSRLTIHHAEQVIGMGESPSKALKSKPNSSIAKCIALQKRGEVEASISGGSTGAFMGASLFGLGRIESVSRPAIGVTFPTINGYSLLLDAGANADCRPHHLFQFSRMGEIFAKHVWEKKSPTVGLLSVGEESSKGNELTIATHAMLLESDINFVGNIEGNGVVLGKCDVMVCDGFIGNVLLKLYEAIPIFLNSVLGDLIDSEKMAPFQEKFNKENYGGADLLGVNGVVIICHGSSTGLAIKNAIVKAGKMIQNRVNEIIKRVVQGDPQCFD